MRLDCNRIQTGPHVCKVVAQLFCTRIINVYLFSTRLVVCVAGTSCGNRFQDKRIW